MREPSLVTEAARLYPGRVAVALDARDGMVAVAGWAQASELSALDIARRFEDAGIAVLIYTDISRDGMLAGLNLDATIALADAVRIPVIASGGRAWISLCSATRCGWAEGWCMGRAVAAKGRIVAEMTAASDDTGSAASQFSMPKGTRDA